MDGLTLVFPAEQQAPQHARESVRGGAPPDALSRAGDGGRSFAAPRPRNIALATGGTAGHVTPALAVAAAYRAARPDVRVVFLGNATGFEQHLVAAHGYGLETVPAAPLYGATARGRLRAVSQLAVGVRRARHVLTRERIDLVIGFGGYASAGAVLGARSLGLAAALHEANVGLGLTNRLLGSVVDRVLLGWEGAATRAAGRRGRVVGTPIRPDIAALAGETRRPLDAARLHVLVCGGSQGSPFLNRHAPELVGVLRGAGVEVAVRHQSGSGGADDVRAAYARWAVSAQVEAYVDDMAAAYRWADVAIACGGAATLAELAAAGLPALLVPLAAAADDHQAENAAAFAAATGVPWVREAAWDAAAVGQRLLGLLRDRDAWSGLCERTRRQARLDAAAAVVAQCEALLTSR